MLERELYEGVKLYLEDLGYQVQAEVKDCDVVAQKGEDLVIVELKRNLSVRLLVQGVQRQKLGADVYLAVPKPSRYQYDKKHRELLHLLRRLELGLLFVTPEKNLVEVALHPQPLDLKKVLANGGKKKRSLQEELDKRQFSLNQGGSRGVKILTAYREQALFLCCALSELEKSSPKELADLTGIEAKKISMILTKNVYGWFDKIEKGVYRLSSQGKLALEEYSQVAKFYFTQLHKNELEEKD